MFWHGRSAWLAAIQRVRGGRCSGYLPRSSAAVSLKPHIRLWCVSGCQSCHGKRKKCRTADALCRLDPSLTPQYDSELDLGSPEALIPRDEESSEEEQTVPTEMLVARDYLRAQPVEGVFHNRPCLQVNLLCRSDWLRMRGIAETECMILPVRELAAFSLVQCMRPAQSRGALLGAMVPVGPSASRRIPAGSHIQCLGLGAWAEQTAPALGAQTVSTAQIQTSGNCFWKWTETGATTDW